MSTLRESAPEYHAHLYYEADSRDRAWALRELIANTFPELKVGHFHEKNVGPHPRWSCQVTFPLESFSAFVPWLMMNRNDITIFLHPLTGDNLPDHQDFPLWMGEMLPLNLDMFKK